MQINIQGKNNKSFYFNLDSNILATLSEVKVAYKEIPEYDIKKGYKQNVIKITLSDIDIESAVETSYIDSLSAILCGKIKNKNQRTAQNLLKMLELGILDKYHELSHDNIIEIWKCLTDGNRTLYSTILNSNGYRNTPVHLMKGYFNIVYTAPKASEVYNKMTQLIDFVNNATIVEDVFYNAILKSIIFSAVFVYIHPFADGNGRTSRLLFNKLLIDNGLNKFRYVSLNMEISKNKLDYSNYLLKIEKENSLDLTEYIRFMLNLMLDLFRRLTNPNRKEINWNSLSKREKIMTQIIKSNSKSMSVKDYKKMWNMIAFENNMPKIKVEDAEKDLKHLFELDVVVVENRIKSGIYFKYYNK